MPCGVSLFGDTNGSLVLAKDNAREVSVPIRFILIE